jgi:hypothetical protein
VGRSDSVSSAAANGLLTLVSSDTNKHPTRTIIISESDTLYESKQLKGVGVFADVSFPTSKLRRK